ncbi:hypothetical protein [Methanolobus psychrotolerans]|uniref:hypothetical protein n=1 Tax=Methanolobus psychrotolerans TaxID=1874706 RepID=UPI000B9183FD|nr:hypothetical protein [Methanolobus psychrotolerans]
MVQSGRRKVAKSYAMDEYLIERVATLAETGKYGSQSNIVSLAVAEFLARNESTIREQQSSAVAEHISDYLKSPDGKALIKSIISESLSVTNTKQKETVSPKETTKKNPVVIATEEYVTDDILGRELK